MSPRLFLRRCESKIFSSTTKRKLNLPDVVNKLLPMVDPIRKSLTKNVGKWSVTTGERDTGRFCGLFDTEDEALYFVYLVCDLETIDPEFKRMVRDVKWVCGYGCYKCGDLTYWVEEIAEDRFDDELCGKDISIEDFSELLRTNKLDTRPNQRER